MKEKRKWILLSIITLVLMALIIFIVGRSFGFFRYAKEGEIANVITIKGIEVSILNESNDALNLTDVQPVYDSEGLTNTPFEFSMTNTSSRSLNYNLVVENNEEAESECQLENGDACEKLTTNYIRYSYKKDDGTYSEPLTLGEVNNVIHTGTIEGGETINFSIILWVSSEAGNEIMNKYFFGKLVVQGNQNTSGTYQEVALNGADPVLTDNLVPVTIDNDGTVSKADTNDDWYSYSKHEWANAVVLKDTTTTYEAGDTIPEDNIESYFVWIPKYSYQIWNLGNYSSLTSISSQERMISVRFGLDNTSDTNTGECTTPQVAGESGNCEVGEYMTHPAFLAFDTNGLWVGKFETGYDGATSTSTAQVNSSDSSKIIIKPNVYSWRSSTVGNMFKASLDYLTSDNSHMMKNTEWGAVAYLQHSAYGSQTSARINNNSAFITGYASTEEPTLGYNAGTSLEGNRVESTAIGVDGTYTINYLNNKSVVASTTENYTGIYDMSGGAWDEVMSYNTEATTVGGSSEITSLYSDFFTNSEWEKYYDKYSSTVNTNYNNRILGDATGEMGPFASETDLVGYARIKSSWYKDYADFVCPSYPWFQRGASFHHGYYAGNFAFYDNTGTSHSAISYRVVLAPTK